RLRHCIRPACSHRLVMTGAELKQTRTAAGVTIAELARELGRAESSVFRTEHRGRIQPNSLLRYLDGLEVCAARKREQRDRLARRLVRVGRQLAGTSR